MHNWKDQKRRNKKFYGKKNNQQWQDEPSKKNKMGAE